jgi:hypothetical protein
MAGMAGVTHSLRVAAAATALVAAGASTALGQSPAAQTLAPSRPSAPAAADEDTSSDRRGELPRTPFSDLSLFDDRLTKSTDPTFVVRPSLSGVEMACVGCRGFETTVVRPESTTSNAPWALRGRWRRQTTLGVVSTGFLEVCNYALPLSTAIPLGGDLDPDALSTAGAAVDSAISMVADVTHGAFRNRPSLVTPCAVRNPGYWMLVAPGAGAQGGVGVPGARMRPAASSSLRDRDQRGSERNARGRLTSWRGRP